MLHGRRGKTAAHSLERQNCQPADRRFHGETAIADDNPRRPGRRPFVRQIPPAKGPRAPTPPHILAIPHGRILYKY